MMNEVKLTLEVDSGTIYINNNVSVYVNFHKECNKLLIDEIFGCLSIEAMGAVLTYLSELEENLR